MNLNSICTIDCTGNTYPDGAGGCNTCPTGCATCSSDILCLTCDLNYALHNDLCVNPCPEAMFVNTASSPNICSNCMTDCKLCSDASSCTTCYGDFEFTAGTCSCPIKSVVTGPQQCTSCPINCDVCDATLDCTSCSSGYAENPDGTCVDPCSGNFYMDGPQCV